VIEDTDGDFISGWEMNDGQLQNVEQRGVCSGV